MCILLGYFSVSTKEKCGVKNVKLKKVFREVIVGILPIALLITILQFTITPVAMETYLTFLGCTVFVIVGLFLFLIGIQYGFLEAGENIGRATVKLGKMKWILLVTVLLGFGVTLLEPDVQVFSNQAAGLIESVNGETLCTVIAIGVGLFVGISFLRMFLNISIKYILIVGYLLVFGLVMFCPQDLASAAFDAGGATTGALTVPFLLSLSMGISSMLSKKKDTSDSFGIIGIASLGPILSVLIMGVINR